MLRSIFGTSIYFYIHIHSTYSEEKIISRYVFVILGYLSLSAYLKMFYSLKNHKLLIGTNPGNFGQQKMSVTSTIMKVSISLLFPSLSNSPFPLSFFGFLMLHFISFPIPFKFLCSLLYSFINLLLFLS